MAYPIDIGTIALYRGDTRTLPFAFYGAPDPWAPDTEYSTGEVGSAEYVENTTVTYQGSRYTCINAHTSGATFDADQWIVDPNAVGGPINLTAFGSVITSKLRKKQDDFVVVTVDTSESDLENGSLVMSITADDWNDMATYRTLGFDIEIATPDRSSVTTLVVGTLTIGKDYTYDSYGS